MSSIAMSASVFRSPFLRSAVENVLLMLSGIVSSLITGGVAAICPELKSHSPPPV